MIAKNYYINEISNIPPPYPFFSKISPSSKRATWGGGDPSNKMEK